MYFVTPLGALFRGLAAGVVGSYAQNLFFKHTQRFAPETPKKAFEPPEPQQKGEMGTQTIARRFTEGFVKRGPLENHQKKVGGKLVHYAFGGGWGGLYGLARESFPRMAHPLGALAFGAVVMGVSEGVLLPLFRLAATSNKYPLKVHAYSLAAHLAYGAAVAGSYELMRRQPWDALAAGIWAVGTRRRIRRFLPKAVRPAAKTLVNDAAWVYAHHPILRAQAAARA